MEQLIPSMKGMSYMQDNTTTDKVTFEDNRVTGNLEYCHNLIMQVHPNPQEDVKYALMHAMLIARVIDDINSKVLIQGTSFVQQYILQKGLKVFGDQGREASTKEMDQLHRQSCFTPISIKEMMPEEHKKAMEALMFLMEKHNELIKGQMVYNRKPTREWLTREDSASLMAALESIMLTKVINAHKECNVMTVDIQLTSAGTFQFLADRTSSLPSWSFLLFCCFCFHMMIFLLCCHGLLNLWLYNSLFPSW